MALPDGVRPIDGLETEAEYLAYAAIIFSSEGGLASTADELTEHPEESKVWVGIHKWLVDNVRYIGEFEDWVDMAKALAPTIQQMMEEDQ